MAAVTLHAMGLSFLVLLCCIFFEEVLHGQVDNVLSSHSCEVACTPGVHFVITVLLEWLCVYMYQKLFVYLVSVTL